MNKSFLNLDSNFQQQYFHLLPKDKDSNFNLLDLRPVKIRLDNLVLEESLKINIADFVSEYNNREVLITYGMKPRNKLLFCGPPGCGKTVTAEAIATELNLPLLYTRFDSVISSYLGETATNLRKIFDFIQKEKWILFFDEFDSIGKSRDNQEDHGELKRIVNTFLQLLDLYDGPSIIIAATNYQRILDPAIWRRFDEVLYFDRPSEVDINCLLQKLLKRYPTSEIDFMTISKNMKGLSHSDVERIVLDTIKKAIIEQKKKINNHDLEQQVKKYMKRVHIYQSVDKVEEVSNSDTSKIIKTFLQRLDTMSGTGNGIGKSTVEKVKDFAKKEGFII